MLRKGAIRSGDYSRRSAADVGFCDGCPLHLSLREGGRREGRETGRERDGWRKQAGNLGGRHVERDGMEIGRRKKASSEAGRTSGMERKREGGR